MFDETWFVDNLQAQQAAPANSTAPADGSAPPKKKASKPSQKFVTAVAVKFVNAMWATLFAKVMQTGYSQYTLSVRYYNASSSTEQGYMNSSTAYKSFKYSSVMLLGWGFFGWTAFLMKRFVDNKLSRQLALMAARGTGIVGLVLTGLSLWKTFGREKCSADSNIWQCWYDSNPSDIDSWYNTAYVGESRTAYLLAFQMLWTSKTTLKVLTADFKFKDASAGKKQQPAKGGDSAPPAKDGAASPAPAEPAAALFRNMEHAAWGL